jgi:hypothetical protein
MAKLEEYLGGIIDSLSQARLMADMRTADTARLYAEHDVLRAMSVPRMRFGNVELNIPLAIDRAESPASRAAPARFNPDEMQKQLVGNLADNFGSGRVTATLTRVLVPAIRRHTELLIDAAGNKPTDEHVRKFSSVLARDIQKLVETKRLRMREGVKFERPKIEETIYETVKPLVIAAPKPPLTEETQVIYEASRLREMRPDDLIRIKMIVEEDSMEWHQIEHDDGTTERKLLPE